MSKKSALRGAKRRAEAAQRKEAIAQQYGLPASAMANRTPEFLGRAMFLHRAEAKRFETAFGKARRGEGIPEYLKQKQEQQKTVNEAIDEIAGEGSQK